MQQVKATKKPTKRNVEKSDVDGHENHEKPKKKVKTVNTEERDLTETNGGVQENAIKTLNTSIFQFFTDLTQEDEESRLKAALLLIQELSKTKEPEKRKKELAYALKRLVRGCGAATNASRSGFFTGLVALFKSFKHELEIPAIFDTVQKELHVGATIANKEDADAVVGKILVCGALLRAGLILELNSENLERITNILLQATRHRSYHTSLGYAFLIEIIETALSQQQFEDAMWPLLHKELSKPWSKQSLQTVHCLLIIQRKFPSIFNAKYLKTHFGGRELLNSESFVHLQRIFWSHSDTHVITHPAFEAFGTYLASCSNLVEFWTQCVDTGMQNPTKISEFLTLKIATDVLQNLQSEKAGAIIVELLSPNFMKMLVNGLKQIKLKKDETLKAFYDEYMEALVACCSQLPPTADVHKATIIRRLILYPGKFDIEKYTSTRIIHQLINTLNVEGVKDIFQLYKRIFCGTLPKQTDEHSTEEWQNFERLNAGFMLQHLLSHKAVQHQQNAFEWRAQQLQFLLTCGIFHVQQIEDTSLDENGCEPCKKEAACSFSKEFGEQCKNMFFTSLQSKLTNLQQERKLLLDLVEFCDQFMQKSHFERYLRGKHGQPNEKLILSAWQKMVDAVVNTANTEKVKTKAKGTSKNEDKLQMVFHIMLLNMGLQIFREPEMAAPAIDDLQKCMHRTQRQQKHQRNIASSENGTDEGNEPEWIEVVIDLFLHLLSQNTGALRNSVNRLFPHLCENLNATAIHQILGVLDMKDGNNPLSRKGDEDDEEEENSDEEENEEEGQDSEDSESDEEENNDEASDDDDVESSDDEEEEEEEESDDDADITATDKLRNAISQALIANGASLNGAVGNDDDDDMASVDLNDMTEEEGQRLDAALAAAFKSMKKTSNATGGERKKSKSQRVETTTVMHFRIRVLDLLEIYLQQPEIFLLNHIEIMLGLYNMLEYCWSEELKPLQAKVEKVLQKLTTIKPMTAGNIHIDELKPEDMVNYIRQIAEKKTPTMGFDLTNKIRNKCIVYLISNASKISNGDERMRELCLEYQTEFINSRNPTVNITLLSEVYKLRWSGVWQLALKLAEKGLKMETRAFRRIQVCEILAVLYKNFELHKNDVPLAQKQLKSLERYLIEYIDGLIESWSKPLARQSHKEFQTLLEVVLQAKRTHVHLKTLAPAISSANTCEKVQELRRHIRLESANVYQRFCGVFKLSVLRNTDVVTESTATLENESNSENEANDNSSNIEKQKRPHKKSNTDARKQKKQKKLERMLAASKGISGGFGFKQKEEDDDDEIDE